MHVVDLGGQGRAEGGKENGDQEHKNRRQWKSRESRAETKEKGQTGNNDPLKQGDRGASHGTADHDMEPGHGGHQGFLQESELPVPDNLDPRENAGKKNAHGDNPRRQELKIVPVAGLGINLSEAKTKGQ